MFPPPRLTEIWREFNSSSEADAFISIKRRWWLGTGAVLDRQLEDVIDWQRPCFSTSIRLKAGGTVIKAALTRWRERNHHSWRHVGDVAHVCSQNNISDVRRGRVKLGDEIKLKFFLCGPVYPPQILLWDRVGPGVSLPNYSVAWSSYMLEKSHSELVKTDNRTHRE